MELIKTQIDGCYELQPNIFRDARGSFVKIYNQIDFTSLDLETEFKEQYYSVSKKNVIRGMHFQLPPHDHVKLVSCLHGAVFDVVTDLRVGSPTYGKSQTFELTANKANSIYISRGMAHGFCALSDEAVLSYSVTSVFSHESDAGILWSSIGVDWPSSMPYISDRDIRMPSIQNFCSPFKYT